MNPKNDPGCPGVCSQVCTSSLHVPEVIDQQRPRVQDLMLTMSLNTLYMDPDESGTNEVSQYVAAKSSTYARSPGDY